MSKEKLPVQKNQKLKGRVEDLTHEGMGVVKVEGYPLFIEDALPEEEIIYKVVKTGKKFGFGRLLTIEEKSPHRVDRDDVYRQTGTMPLEHMDYPSQLRFKQKQVQESLRRIGHLEDVEVLPTLGMENPYGYRNKAQIPVRMIDGQLTTGFFRQRSHDLIPMEDFKIQDPKIDEALVLVRDILRKYDVPAYDEDNHRGQVRHIVVRRGYFTGELMIVFVTRKEELDHGDEVIEDILKALPETVAIIQNVNPKETNVILGRDFNVLYGEDKYKDRLFDFTFEISHQSFYQVNPIQTQVLYQTALDFADLEETDVVVDAYCGIGTLTLTLAQEAGQVYGIEIVPPAIDNAKRNAEINGVENVDFVLGAAEEVLPQWAKEGRKVDVIVFDPPRKGLDQDFIEATLQMAPDKMVYVSCNPATLARDLKIFNENGYEVIKAQPVDMFPQTTHIETVVLIEKNK